MIVRRESCITMKELRRIIRDLREDNDIKQKTIAEYLGVSQQTYSNYENGHRDIPIWAVVKLSKFYQVSTDYLLGADSGYLGNTNLNGKYLGDVTLHDVVYDLQKLSAKDRRDLLKYIRFLKHSD
ncbi:MAG: helix-turn-helix domain-containing protein [Lachnospiraceae bacterium]|nr:helix-turn-helix domain-containing protein [Lachnospiraceae bacterium]